MSASATEVHSRTSAGKASWTSLPDNVKKIILRYAGLHIPRQYIGSPQGFMPRENLSRQVPRALFHIDAKTSSLARTILFSENRIILRGNHQEDATWLQRQPRSLLAQVQRLDLYLSFFPSAPTRKPPHWDDLVSAVAEKFDLSRLTLSINAVHAYNIVVEDCFDFTWLKALYSSAIAPFEQRSTEHFSKLEAFFVFYPKFSSLEAKAEKSVMGKNYHSEKLGKIAYKDRDWRLPHGWESATEDEEGEPLAEWLDYEAEREWMHDAE